MSGASSREIKGTDPVEWVERYGDVLFRYAMTRLPSRTIAEDVVQETFLAALRSRDQFAGASSEQTWLIGILRRKIVDYFRASSRGDSRGATNLQQEEDFDQGGYWRYSPGPWPQNPAQTLETSEFWEAFEECLGKLPAALAQAFRLREFDDFSSEEICGHLGVSASHLNVRIHRARMALRRCLEQNWFSRGKVEDS